MTAPAAVAAPIGAAAPAVQSPGAISAPPPIVWLGACEVSGDRHAAHLAATLRAAWPGIRLRGLGGEAMQAAGVDVRMRTTDFGFVGIVDGVRQIGSLARLFRAAQRQVLAERPDLFVLIDSEFVTTPFAMWLRRHRIPAAFFFPPQVWLWGRWRMPAVRPLARRFVSAFAAEAELYAASGADTVFAGHPLRDLVRVDDDPIAALRAVGLDPGRPLVALMPGSRRSEVSALLAPMLAAARILQAREPRLQFAVPLAEGALRPAIEAGVRASGVRDIAVYPHDSYAILSRARLVLQCAGTATLEAGLLGVPAVIAYRTRELEYRNARHLLFNVRYIGMVNVLLDAPVQPELMQDDVNPERLAAEAWSLLTDEPRRRAIQRRLAELPDRLGPPGAFARASDALLSLIPGYAT
ncbi:MAG: lipid-A-disaccharide synthase [Deltaproteobacteria bacterium]|nr:lipid-A-disaccharide synthase [Deltaproteobacteria bacterium]